MKVADLLDKFLADTEVAREPDGKWHPSSLYLCDRQAVYSVRGVEQSNPPDAMSLRRFRIGHVLHELLQEAIGKAGTLTPEVLVDMPDLNITGHADGIFVDDDGDVWVLEIKSTRALGKIKKGGAQEHHVKQAATYAVAFRRTYGELLKGIIMLYFEKNDALTEEIEIAYDPEWEVALKRKIEHLEQYRLDPDSLPPRLPLVKGKVQWPCNYCSWKDKCWGEDPAEKPLKPVEEW